MGIDQEDPGELAALRERAEAELALANAARAEILTRFPGMGEGKLPV